MPTDKDLDQLGRLDTSTLYQPFLAKLCDLLNACAARGAIYVATSGLRSYAEQDKLYAYGRTDMSRGIVTKAKAGFSAHNFGVAIDAAPHVGGPYAGKLNPDYAEKNYKILGEECAKLGLDWGGSWATFKDLPHVQVNLKKHGFTWNKMRALYAAGGYEAVFKELDKYQW